MTLLFEKNNNNTSLVVLFTNEDKRMSINQDTFDRKSDPGPVSLLMTLFTMFTPVHHPVNSDKWRGGFVFIYERKNCKSVHLFSRADILSAT